MTRRVINPGLKAALEATGGSWRRLAEALGMYGEQICGWQRVPADFVLDVERVTGVPRHVLRPDLFKAEMTG